MWRNVKYIYQLCRWGRSTALGGDISSGGGVGVGGQASKCDAIEFSRFQTLSPHNLWTFAHLVLYYIICVEVSVLYVLRCLYYPGPARKYCGGFATIVNSQGSLNSGTLYNHHLNLNRSATIERYTTLHGVIQSSTQSRLIQSSNLVQ